ncbi:hypothetical protein [Micromonospora sp. NPDC049679]|uniref:hypothetical protein n=1 Tax=Micromonospora sp. NPDC049679 TaxID=3155920 RepID=UPI0033E9FB4A
MAQPPMRSEYTPGSPPPIPVPAGTPMPPGRRLRVTLAIVGGMVLLLCMGSVGMAYALYDNATAPDRSAPDVAVDNYLRALLIERDDTAAALYSCRGADRLDAIKEFREDLQSREKRFGSEFSVQWGALAVNAERDLATVRAELKISTVVDDFPQTDLQAWTFETRQEDGWRVCGAERAD